MGMIISFGSQGGDSLDGGAGNDWIYVSIDSTASSTVKGGAGDDYLASGKGSDLLDGGAGNDTYQINSNTTVIRETSTLPSEIDSVDSSINYSLGATLENLTLNNWSDALIATGNILDNKITGNGENNLIKGEAGDDTLIGEGLMMFRCYYTFAPGDIPWSAPTSDDTLIGGDGSDSLDGGGGKNFLDGGDGSDSYLVNSSEDTVLETSTLATEIDSVTSKVSYTLTANVENLTLIDPVAPDDYPVGPILYKEIATLKVAAPEVKLMNPALIDPFPIDPVPVDLIPLNGTGNSLDNVITGGDLDNLLEGKAGNDSLIGGKGNDTLIGYGATGESDLLTGGDGSDVFVLSTANKSVISDLTASDLIQLPGSAADYILDKTQNLAGTGSLDTGIFTQGGDLIGVIQDNTSLLTSTNNPLFSFV